MRMGNDEQKNKGRFINKIVNEAEWNLEQTLREYEKRVIIIPYKKAEYCKIQKYIQEINEEAEKKHRPFKAFLLKDFPGEIRFAYIDSKK